MAKVLVFTLSAAEWTGISRGLTFQELMMGGLVDVRLKGPMYLLRVLPEDEARVRDKLEHTRLNPQEKVFAEGLKALQKARM